MKKILISTLGMLFMTASAFAANVGVSGTALYYSASGTETTKSSGEKNDKSDSGFAPMVSVFVEQELDTGVMVGLDLMPYSAKIGSGSMDKDDDAETSGTNKVDVNFKNHVTLYAEIPTNFGGIDGGFVKLGVHRVSLETDENLSTGSTYGDENVTGFMLGFGRKGDLANGGFFKIEGQVSRYGGATFDAATGGNAAGDGSVFNKVELDDFTTAGIKFSVGRAF